MQKLLQWLGWLSGTAGIVLIGAYFVISRKGLAASYNFGDPVKFQFILVPFWQIGIVIVVLGGVLLLASRWFNRARE